MSLAMTEIVNYTWKHDDGARLWNAGVRRLCLAVALLALMAVVALEAPAPVGAQSTDQPGTVTLSTNQPEMGIPMTATLTDPDGSISATTWQWSSSDTSDGTFTDISGATEATYRPAEADRNKYLKATASYTDGHGSGKTAEATSTNAVHVVDRKFLDNLGHLTGPGISDRPGWPRSSGPATTRGDTSRRKSGSPWSAATTRGTSACTSTRGKEECPPRRCSG